MFQHDTAGPGSYPGRAIIESKNLSNLEIVDIDENPDRLTELTRLRKLADERPAGTRILVRHIRTEHNHVGFVYGLTVPHDFPHWRGNLADIAHILTSSGVHDDGR